MAKVTGEIVEHNGLPTEGSDFSVEWDKNRWSYDEVMWHTEQMHALFKEREVEGPEAMLAIAREYTRGLPGVVVLDKAETEAKIERIKAMQENEDECEADDDDA